MNIFFSKSDILPLRMLKILLALCLATPILAFSGVIFPYTVPKFFAFRVLVEIAAVFYLYLALRYPAIFCAKTICHPERSEGSIIYSSSASWRTQNDKKKNSYTDPAVAGEGSFNFINFFVLAFLVVSFLSAFFGADFYSSFWGNLERGVGVFGLLHFAAWFIMLSSVLNFDRAIKEVKEGELTRSRGGRAPLRDGFFYQLIKISVFTSTLISLLAILQHFFSLSDLLPQADRVYSLIGNAGVLGSYLIFNIFLAGYLFLELVAKKNSYSLLAIRYWLLSLAPCSLLGISPNRYSWRLARLISRSGCLFNNFIYKIFLFGQCHSEPRSTGRRIY